jgi:hypothetical protein
VIRIIRFDVLLMLLPHFGNRFLNVPVNYHNYN